MTPLVEDRDRLPTRKKRARAGYLSDLKHLRQEAAAAEILDEVGQGRGVWGTRGPRGTDRRSAAPDNGTLRGGESLRASSVVWASNPKK